MGTYEIPTTSGMKTVEASSKAEALKSVKNGGSTLNLNLPQVKSPTTLNSQNTQESAPMVLPPTVPKTEGEGLGAVVESSTNTIKTEKQQAADDAKAQLDRDAKDITRMITDIGDSGNYREQLLKEQGVDVSKKKIDQLTSDIEAEQLATRRKVEKLRKYNPEGLYGGALEDKIADIEAESYEKQADMSIVQNAELRRYDTAVAIVDRQVAAKLEPMKAALEARRFMYENNRDLFNRADAERLKEEERAYEKAEKELTAIGALKLEAAKQGAPVSLINALSKAKTMDEALKIPGTQKYLTTEAERLENTLKRAQISNVYSTIAERNASIAEAKKATAQATKMDADGDFKKLKGNAELKAKLIAYEDLIKEYGAVKKGTKNAAALDNAYQEVLQAYRASKDLGALQGADLSLVDDAIKRATFEKRSFVGGKIINPLTLGISQEIVRGKTKRVANASIDEAFNAIDRNMSGLSDTIKAKNPDWAETDYYKTVVGNTAIDVSADSFVDEVTNAMLSPENVYSSY